MWQTIQSISATNGDLQEETIVEEIDEVIKPRFVGWWAVLGENKSRKRDLFDDQRQREITANDHCNLLKKLIDFHLFYDVFIFNTIFI